MAGRDVDGGVQRNVEHVDRPSARARLHNWNPFDFGIYQSVGVSAYYRVDFRRQLSREVDDLAATLRRAIPPATCAGVGNHDHEIGALFSECGPDTVDDWGGIVEAESDDIGGTRSRRCRHRRQTDDADLRPTARHDRVVRNPFYVAAVGVADVGAEDTEFRLPHPGTERIDTPIEFVIAERRSSVSHPVVIVDHWSAE